MATLAHTALASWSFPAWLTGSMLLGALLYLRGWLGLRSAGVAALPAWRAASFFVGLCLIWAAVGSPIASLDDEFLTAHMIQHLLLMTLAPPLLWLGAPVMPLLHGLPQRVVQTLVGPVLRWPPLAQLTRIFGRLELCWLAATAALVAWHIPALFARALHSEALHAFEHASFLATGLLFWWPVIRPWPSARVPPQWSILLYLFLATLPCDILSGFLVFSERVAYPVYLSRLQRSAYSVLSDQQCAGALMWTFVTVVYLLPAAMLTTRLLAPRSALEHQSQRAELPGQAVSETEPRRLGVA